mmetsp:Transcript_22028/g.62623  ORF Transcript_22028/g.62623 Transcript_22028/m.62623 type:complete len:102 (-) Transcript_22028:66-371(-)
MVAAAVEVSAAEAVAVVAEAEDTWEEVALVIVVAVEDGVAAVEEAEAVAVEASMPPRPSDQEALLDLLARRLLSTKRTLTKSNQIKSNQIKHSPRSRNDLS